MEVNIGQGATEVPIGFGLGLAMNEQAMAHYSQMTEEERLPCILDALKTFFL